MRFIGAYVALLALTGCTGPSVNRQGLGTSDTLATTAETRLVYSRPTNNWTDGRVTPDHIVCAEPSPDVAKAIATALSAAIEAEAKGTTGTISDPKAGISLSRSRSESIAQLGKRLGTIQLLRDGLFSACEAYANGALTRTSYAFLLSRFGDVMVTMLAIELAAGESPSMATITAQAGVTHASLNTLDANTGTPAGQGSAGGSKIPAGAPQDGGTGQGAKDQATTIRTSLTDQQVITISKLQQEFLLGSDSGPLLMTCATVLERTNEELKDLVNLCKGFIAKYADAKIDLVHARRLKVLHEVPNPPPTPPTSPRGKK